MRVLYAKYPAICTPSCSEIHINECECENMTFFRGNAVSWLSAFEKAEVDVVSRARRLQERRIGPMWYADLGATR